MLARLGALTALIAVVVAGYLILRGDGSNAKPTPQAKATPTKAKHAKRAKKARFSLPKPPADVKGAAARRMKVPILMYHVVSAPPAGTPNPELWVSQDTFAAEMRALRKAGYYAITLKQAFDAWQDGGPLPSKPLVVSFDDGYLSQYTHARPVLRRLGWPGVLNLEWNNLGKGGVTEREVKVMLGDGWELDSHTLTHPDLTTVPDARLRTELTQSRKDIKAKFGASNAEFFCYPAGKYDARVVAAVKAAGYRGATTVDEGLGERSQPFTLKRIRVNASDTPQTLLSRLKPT